MSPLLSVLVISYNTRELTLACLESIAAHRGEVDLEVLVVDNASDDGSAEAIAGAFPDASLTALDENLGFARANNLAAQEALGEYVLLLNPDTLVLAGAFEALLACAAAHPEGGLVGGRTLFEDHSLNPTSCWQRMTVWSLFCMGAGLSSVFRGSPLFNPEAMGGWKRDSEREVDIVTGCVCLLRRELWEELGGFDSRFFMYGEDVDLSLRAEELGRACRIAPDAEIVHFGGRSERVRSHKMATLFRARCQVLAKHESALVGRFGCAMHSCWALTRMVAHRLLLLIPGRSRDGFEAWRDTWARRAEWGWSRVEDMRRSALDHARAPDQDVPSR